MNYKILLFFFCLGILVGVTVVQMQLNKATGAVISDCYSNNEPCACDNTECQCGNQTIPAEYCKTLNSAK